MFLKRKFTHKILHTLQLLQKLSLQFFREVCSEEPIAQIDETVFKIMNDKLDRHARIVYF